MTTPLSVQRGIIFGNTFSLSPRHRWTVDWLSFHDLTPLTIYTLAVISVSFFLLGKWRVGGRGFSPDLTDLLTNASDEGGHSFLLANAFLWEGSPL